MTRPATGEAIEMLRDLASIVPDAAMPLANGLTEGAAAGAGLGGFSPEVATTNMPTTIPVMQRKMVIHLDMWKG